MRDAAAEWIVILHVVEQYRAHHARSTPDPLKAALALEALIT